MTSWQAATQRATDAGFLPGAVAETAEGLKVWIVSHPYSDAEAILILVRTNPDDPYSWQELLVKELTITERTPE
jgi:hypothetical protein